MDLQINSDSSPLQYYKQQTDFYNPGECVYCEVGTGDLNIQNLGWYESLNDRLCGLVVRVSGYRYRGLGFDSRRYQIF